MFAEARHDLYYWLGIWRAPRVGAKTFQRLLQYFQTPELVFQGSASDYAACRLAPETIAYLLHSKWQPAVEADLKWLEKPHNAILTPQESAYPALLKAIADPPPVLFVHGQIEALCYPQLAMVGSRRASPQGRETAYNFAHQLARRGLTITSGLALGIDAASHEGALSADGFTIAVAATGLDRVYPAQHRGLAHKIAQQGALISEFPLGTAPAAHHFPQRNRIISGLANGVLVVEANLPSGSLLTTQYALEQGREVLAIPGSIYNPGSRGCHALIKQGAKLVESIEDILEEIGPVLAAPAIIEALTPATIAAPKPLPLAVLDTDCQRLLASLGTASLSVDELVQRSQMEANKITALLLYLELEGYIVTQPGGLYSSVSRIG